MAENLNFNSGITINLISAGAVAGATNTITTTVNTLSVINGKFTTVYAAAATVASPILDGSTGVGFLPLVPSKTCALVIGINQAGAMKMCQGPIIDTRVGLTTVVGDFINAPQFPELPDDFCPLAYTVVRTAPSALPWTPGTGAWAASGVSCSTFRNVGQLPNRPQVT